MSVSNKGIWAEKKVKDYLEVWQQCSPMREFSRLTDAKAAGRIIKAAAADFEYFTMEHLSRVHGLIEVKETAHDFRLSKDRLTQLPRLRKREKCGGSSYVLIYHTGLKKWRAVSVHFLMGESDKGSWNLSEVPLSYGPGEALKDASRGEFT